MITLQKGGNIKLHKEAPGLNKLRVGLGWDVRTTEGASFDLDASAFLLKEDEKVRSDADFIFYNQPKDVNSSVEHTGDNLTGEGENDDEQIKIDLSRVVLDIQKIAIVVSIHDADTRRQNFGMVENAFVRVINEQDGVEIVRYDLSEDYSLETALIFAELYRHKGEWKFKAIGQGHSRGLGVLANKYGVQVG